MGGPSEELGDALSAEFGRLNLNVLHVPGLTGTREALARLLSRMQTMDEGVTWPEVLPDWPSTWVPGRPETWVSRYRPSAGSNYEPLPTGHAVQVTWTGVEDVPRLEALVDTARRVGWPVHRAGFIGAPDPTSDTAKAVVVLRQETSEERVGEFIDWIDANSGPELNTVRRHEGTRRANIYIVN
jgi:hypothetical protein